MSNRRDEKEEEEKKNIRVAVRVRPLNSREKKQGSCCEIHDHVPKEGEKKRGTILRVACKTSSRQRSSIPKTPKKALKHPLLGKRMGPLKISTPGASKFKRFEFDFLFGPNSTNEEIFNDVVMDGVNHFLKGINATVMAYGQTSSGKTFTMTGDQRSPGVVPLATRAVFEHVKKKSEEVEFFLRVTMCEVYNEQVRDLLRSNKDNTGPGLKVKRDGEVAGLKSTIVKDPKEVFQLIERGQLNRTSGNTNLNSHSSRSHSIFRLHLESRPRRFEDMEEDEFSDEMDDDDDEVTVSVLTLVDLAGSERAKETGAKGKRFQEGNNINKSLMTLRRTIKLLNERKTHIPFRDSLLTKILQPSLGGNARTAVICNITPSSSFQKDTESTLEFAKDVSQIANKVKVNRIKAKDAKMKAHAKEVQQLRRNLKYGENAANAPMSPQQQTEGKKKKKGLIQQVVRLGRFMFPGSSSKKRRNGDEAGTSHSKKRRMSAPASQFALLDALNSVASDEEKEGMNEEGKKPEDFRTMQIDQLRKRVVELSEDLECSERAKEEAMELVRESEDKARSRVEYYETRNAILTAEDVSDLKENQLQEQEQIHMKALLRLSRERVERERRAEHSILRSELQTCKKKLSSMRQEKEALEERLRVAEKSTREALEENEKLRGLNLRLELRVKSQENEARKSCQKKPEDPDAKENRLSSNNETDVRMSTILSPSGASSKRATLQELWGSS